MDINFFASIKKKKKKTKVSGLLAFAVISLILTLTIVLYISKKMEYISLNNEINDINAIMEHPDFQKQLDAVSPKEVKLEELEKKHNYLLDLTLTIPLYHTAREEIIKSLAKELTKSLSFDIVKIEGNQLTLDGYAASVMDIAQFEYNLNHCKLFQGVIVNTLKEEFATYIFTGKQIKEVIYNYKFDVQLTIAGSDVNLPDIVTGNNDVAGDKAEADKEN